MYSGEVSSELKQNLGVNPQVFSDYCSVTPVTNGTPILSHHTSIFPVPKKQNPWRRSLGVSAWVGGGSLEGVKCGFYPAALVCCNIHRRSPHVGSGLLQGCGTGGDQLLRRRVMGG